MEIKCQVTYIWVELNKQGPRVVRHNWLLPVLWGAPTLGWDEKHVHVDPGGIIVIVRISEQLIFR